MTLKYNNKYIFIIMGILVLCMIYLQFTIDESTENLKTEEIKSSKDYAGKIAKYIQSETFGALPEFLEKNSEKRKNLNKVLQTFLTEQFQYIFLLHKDEKGYYRFLLDGSLNDPVEFNSLFFPKSIDFNTVYSSQKSKIIKQNEGVEEVWLSLLYPIITEGQTEALLVIDLSKPYAEYLSSFNSPVSELIKWIQLFLLVSLFFLLYIFYNFYKLRNSILIDPLTSTFTETYLQEFFDIKKVNQYNAILIDIDEFKHINTKYGHDAGDTIIKKFTEEILILLPEDSYIVRGKGSEFLLIISKKSVDLEDFANRLFKHLTDKRYLIDNNTISLTLSLSAIVIPEETDSIRNIQRILDEKLFEIKSRGKNALCIIGNVSGDEIQYKNIDYIKEALADERLTCLYQPIFDTKTQEIVKYEALVRLIDKDDSQKFIPPSYFLNIIKGTTQYIKMSKLVLKEVFNVLHKNPKIEISINLDLDDLYNADMMKLITKQLYTHRNMANRITFEILENNEIKDYDEVALIFQQLRTFGSKIAIDDFGSGYANYIYLIKLDIDILKIDGSLIQELIHQPERTKVLLKSIIDLSKAYQYEIVAEFVSSKEIYEIVAELDIEYSQGYYLGEPSLLAHIDLHAE